METFLTIIDNYDMQRLKDFGFKYDPSLDQWDRETDESRYDYTFICIDGETRCISHHSEEVDWWSVDDLHDFDDYKCRYINDLISAGIVVKKTEDEVYE